MNKNDTILKTINLPCSLTELENVLLHVSHEGHWHDAEVCVNGEGQLIVVHPGE